MTIALFPTTHSITLTELENEILQFLAQETKGNLGQTVASEKVFDDVKTADKLEFITACDTLAEKKLVRFASWSLGLRLTMVGLQLANQL